MTSNLFNEEEENHYHQNKGKEENECSSMFYLRNRH